MLKEFGSERLIGMLHAFVLLKPLLSKALRDKEEKIIREADLSKFDRLRQTQPPAIVPLDAEEVNDRLNDLHESLDDTCSAFNRTLSALQAKISEQ